MHRIYYLQTKYAGSVLDSRLIVLGLHLDRQQEACPSADSVCQITPEIDNYDESDKFVSIESRTLFYQEHAFHQGAAHSPGSSHDNGQTQGQLWREDTVDFITGIFWILESRRREEVQRECRQERMSLRCTPFEKKDFVGLDLDSRANKKCIYGRYQKYLGDINLICDRIVESYEHYQLAADALR